MTLSPAYERNKVAQAEWRALCRADARRDAEPALREWMARYSELRPEPFIDAYRIKVRKAFTFLRGDVGRLRVLAGEPLELRTVHFDKIGLEAFGEDFFAQFVPAYVKLAFDTLAAAVPSSFWGVIERGEESGRNHVHILVKPGSTKIGASNGVVLDSKLLGTLVYLAKPPTWSFEVALGYVSTKQLYDGAAVGSRYQHRGLTPQRVRKVSQDEIEAALGFSVALPKVLPDEGMLHYVPASPNQFVIGSP